MKVSIIIPYHKGEDYLRDCLDSLIDEAYDNREIILVCDGLEKESINFLKDYAELNINVYHLEEKSGVAAARNMGLEKATGDYIYFLDSDDYLYENTIETLVNVAKETNSDLVYGKRNWTWFQRSIFLQTKREEDSEEEDETSESAQLNAEENFGQETKIKIRDSIRRRDNISINLETEEMPIEETTKEEQREEAIKYLIRKRKGMSNISVLNILFRRSIIENNKIRFNEEILYYSDVPFMGELMSQDINFTKEYEALYIKRRHNDPINLPSLSQIKDPNRFNEYIYAYQSAIEKLQKDSDIREAYEKKVLNYFSKRYAPRLRRSENDEWREENFKVMREIALEMDKQLIKSLKGYQKKVVNALISGDVKKTTKIVNKHLAKRKLKRLLKVKKTRRMFLYVHWFLKRPIKEEWVMLESFFGKSYSDNPKYIYEYMTKNYPGKYKYIWVINDKKTEIPYKHRKIKRFSFRYYYYFARSKYFIFNVRQPLWVRKREGTVFMQTWHGTPLKKLAFDQGDNSSASPNYKSQIYRQSRAWDYFIAPNQFSHEVFRRSFIYDEVMLDIGYPRNDILHSPNKDDIAKKIREELKIPKGKKTVLYAPTWRDDEFYGKGQYKFELQLDLQRMKEALGDEYVVLLRTHYFIADQLDVTGLEGFAYNVSKYNDIAELYLISDILVTDYSSVFFDYANLKRPMIFYTYDLEKYRDILRGFYFNIEKEVPGPLVFTTDEVINAIKNVEGISTEYSQKYDEFYERFCSWEDGQAAAKAAKAVFDR